MPDTFAKDSGLSLLTIMSCPPCALSSAILGLIPRWPLPCRVIRSVLRQEGSCASNVPVSGAAAELYNPVGHSPRPLYWQVRRLVASPKELILRHATRHGGPMARRRAGARHADDLPGDAALRQHRFFRHPRWYGDGGGSPRWLR